MIAPKKDEGTVKESEVKVDEVECLRKTLREEQLRAEDYLNRLKYLQADFENYRKRVEKEVAEVTQLCNERLIKNLLEVVDELELAIQAGVESKEKEAIIDGVKMTLKKLYEFLGREGLTIIETVGKPFDPDKHEAMSRVVTEGHPDGTILSEVRKGFMFKGRVIRPSMVEVAVTPESCKHD